jgi:tetratricopeptide (TPR) repeat protein
VAFVGREDELEFLMRKAALALEASAGCSLFVAGLPGAGKTTLVAEFLERLARERPELAIARGRCLPSFGAADPYLPFVDALRDLADTSSVGAVGRETLSGLLTELAPYWLSVVPMVGNLLSATYATAAKLRHGKDVAPSREALFVQYLELIRSLAQQSPLVLFLDDLHWADQSSIALLNHLSRGIATLPVVVLGTLRSDETALEKHPIADLIRELEREALGCRLEVGELGPASIPHLLALEFGGDISPPLARWVRETAGGNPLFVTELARLLKQSGAVIEERGEWILTKAVAALEVPRTAEAAIEKRVERLTPEAIRVLHYASVEGNEFNSTVLARLLGEDELEVLDQLEAIEHQHQLVRTTGELELPDGDLATTFHFRHALVQTVLYRQVVGKRRILLHRRCAEILEELFPGDATVAGKLAQHFHEGRKGEAAFRYANIAADAARRSYSHWKAEELLRIALEHSPDVDATVRIEERLGDVYDTVGYPHRSLECFRNALEKVTAPGETSVRLHRKLIRLDHKLGAVPAPEILRRTRSLLADAGEYPVERLHLLMDASTLPDVADPVATAQEALEIAESCGDDLLLLSALQRTAGAILLFSADRAEEALPYLARASEIIQRIGDPLRAVAYHGLAGVAHTRLGRYEDAVRETELYLQAATQTGEPHYIASACNNLGYMLLKLGRYREAEQHLLRADQVHERRYPSGRVHSLINLGETARLTGDHTLAIERYSRLIELIQEFEYWDSEAVAHAGLGLTLLAAARVEEAREQADKATASVADRDRWFANRDMVELFLARLELIDGERESALERLRHAAEILRTRDVLLWARVELERARVLGELDPRAALGIVSGVAAATHGMQLSLEGEIGELREQLASTGAEAPTRELAL